MNNKFQIFGSNDSIDMDCMVFVDSLGTTEENKKLCKKFDEEVFKKFQSMGILTTPNCNICVVKSGVVTEVFKGTADEVNNSLFDTYHLHKQAYPRKITRRVERDVTLKLMRGLRIILSFYSRGSHRVEVKKALKGGCYDKLDTILMLCRELVLEESSNCKPCMNWSGQFKTIAFQTAQCMGLITQPYTEVYTKEDAGKVLPLMKPFLDRDDLESIDMGCMYEALITLCCICRTHEAITDYQHLFGSCSNEKNYNEYLTKQYGNTRTQYI